MCGRFYIQSMDIDELRKVIEEIQRHAKETGEEELKVKLGEIAPSDIVPVIANDKNGKATPSLMKWGFRRPDGGSNINARSESVFDVPMFSAAIKSHRCLIPAEHFYEWLHKSKNESIKYEIKADGEPYLFMAGIYRFEKASRVPVFTILTKAPAPNIAFIHDRQPVLIPRELHKEWLASSGDPQKVLREANVPVICKETKDMPDGPVQISFL